MSIKKVAAMAGVSIATVSRCFSHPQLLKQETLEKVEKASEALHYRPNSLAQNFRRGRSGVIVIIIDNIGDPIYESFTQTITHTAQSKGYEILIKETNHKPLTIKYYRDILASKQADGLIVMVDPPKMNTKNQLLFDDLPIIFIKNENQTQTHRHIKLDNSKAAQTATQHLIDLGHKNIAYITPNMNSTAYIRREEGFQQTVDRANFDKPLVIDLSYCQQTPQEAIMHILSTAPQTTAVFCANDDIAMDVLATLKEENIHVPRELSVIGFNNIRYSAKTTPPLTTIEYPLNDIAQYAIEHLCLIIDTPPSSTLNATLTKATFHHRLIERSSTATPPI
jgi:LacI family repressor for deo operon, udp, cdd, tsx, nupC, and nupG